MKVQPQKLSLATIFALLKLTATEFYRLIAAIVMVLILKLVLASALLEPVSIVLEFLVVAIAILKDQIMAILVTVLKKTESNLAETEAAPAFA